ncbi:uncharacterized protein LOC144167780 [Haemaphysalis longicornis]
MAFLDLLCIFSLCATFVLPLEGVYGKTTGLCFVPKSVVKSTQSASIGARLLAKCGRKLALKYKLTPRALHKVFSNTCAIAHLCYSYVDAKKELQDFRNNIVECLGNFGKWIAVSNPELLGEELSRSVDTLVDDVSNCIRYDVPKDKALLLLTVRYLRTFFFTA